MDFEEKIYNTCGTSVSAYKKSIEGKLGKIRSAFIPPDFDSRRKRYTEVRVYHLMLTGASVY